MSYNSRHFLVRTGGKYESELRHNGYEALQGIRLKKLKKAIIEQFGDGMDFITKTTTLGIFDFRAFLNIALLLTESERARALKKKIIFYSLTFNKNDV